MKTFKFIVCGIELCPGDRVFNQEDGQMYEFIRVCRGADRRVRVKMRLPEYPMVEHYCDPSVFLGTIIEVEK